MTTPARQSEDLLSPLRPFVADAAVTVQLIEPAQMPLPYRSLLVHRDDMTQTLERYHHQRLKLEVVHKLLDGDHLRRQVLLVGEDTGTVTEFGAICIDLSRFAGEPRRVIEACRRPLGAILEDHSIVHTCRPAAYFRVAPSAAVARIMRLNEPAELFGRRNTLLDASDAVLAEVVEILPLLNGTKHE